MHFMEWLTCQTRVMYYSQFWTPEMVEYREEINKGNFGEEFWTFEKKRVLARSRWLFALRSVLDDIQSKRNIWKWPVMSQARKDYRRYVQLFMKKKKNLTLNSVEESDLKDLEFRLGYEMQLFCRKMGLFFLKQEKEHIETTKK
jgi:hypothetical protein